MIEVTIVTGKYCNKHGIKSEGQIYLILIS